MKGWALVEAGQASTIRYRERLHAPLRWWVQLTMFLASCWIALIVSTPQWLAWTATAGLCLVGYGLMAYVGLVRVEVTDTELRAGRAHIARDLLGPPAGLDREHTRRVLGVDADARAWLVTRPYIRYSVRVPVLDETDPVPYWLISTRHPSRLLAALGTAPSGPASRPPGSPRAGEARAETSD